MLRAIEVSLVARLDLATSLPTGTCLMPKAVDVVSWIARRKAITGATS